MGTDEREDRITGFYAVVCWLLLGWGIAATLLIILGVL